MFFLEQQAQISTAPQAPKNNCGPAFLLDIWEEVRKIERYLFTVMNIYAL